MIHALYTDHKRNSPFSGIFLDQDHAWQRHSITVILKCQIPNNGGRFALHKERNYIEFIVPSYFVILNLASVLICLYVHIVPLESILLFLNAIKYLIYLRLVQKAFQLNFLIKSYSITIFRTWAIGYFRKWCVIIELYRLAMYIYMK